MTFRSAIPDFQLANPIYTAARVSFYTIDVNGARTDTLATLYTSPIGLVTAANPQTLDGDGKLLAPVYANVPVIAEVVGPNVASHHTGAINARGTWRGDWVTAAVYFSTDLIKDPDTQDIYIAVDNYTSGASVAADEAAGHLELVVDQVLLTGERLAAGLWGPFTDIAAGATVDLGSSDTACVNISGASTTVTSFGSGTNRLRIVKCASAQTIANGASLVTPMAGNFVCPAGSSFIAVSDASGVWRIVTDPTTTSAVPRVDRAQSFTTAERQQGRANIAVGDEYKTLTYATRALAVAATTIPAAVLYVQLLGYSAAGDGGGGLYKKAVSEPAHSGKFQSADGAWWELVNDALVNSRTFGAKADGTTLDHASLQSYADYLDEIGGGRLVLANGPHLTGTHIALPDNVDMVAAGKLSKIVGAASFTALASGPLSGSFVLVTNKDHVAGNSNITVEGVAFDAAAVAGVGHNVLFYNVVNPQVLDSRTNGGNDGIAFVKCTDTVAAFNRIIKPTNAGLDHWEGSDSVRFIGNYIECIGAADGILCTGITTAMAAATTRRSIIAQNVVKNAGNNGIWVQGGSGSGSTVGAVQDIIVCENVIDTVRNFHGIRVSEAVRAIVTRNIINGTKYNGIVVGRENAAGAMADVVIGGNIITGANTGGSTDDFDAAAIAIGAGSSNVQVRGNRVIGATHKYAVSVQAGASNTHIGGNDLTAGSSGLYKDAGTGTFIDEEDNSAAVRRIYNQIVLHNGKKLTFNTAGDTSGNNFNLYNNVGALTLTYDGSVIWTLSSAGEIGSASWNGAAVSNTYLADMAAGTFKANNTGSPEAPSDITVAQAQELLAYPTILGGYLSAANFNTTADQAITITCPTARYRVMQVVIAHASGALTTSVPGLYTAPSKGGFLFANSALATCTVATANANTNNGAQSLALQAAYLDVLTVYLSLTTPQGSAATAGVYIFIQPLP